jgi:acyl carrier protein
MSELEEFKRQIAEELDVEPAALTPETLLADLENWDSVTALTAMVLIEQISSQAVAPEEMAELQTYGDLEDLVRKKLAS